MPLPRYQREANKRFFINLIPLLDENGYWLWPNQLEYFEKRNGQLYGRSQAIEKVRRITDDAFVRRYFVVKE